MNNVSHTSIYDLLEVNPRYSWRRQSIQSDSWSRGVTREGITPQGSWDSSTSLLLVFPDLDLLYTSGLSYRFIGSAKLCQALTPKALHRTPNSNAEPTKRLHDPPTLSVPKVHLPSHLDITSVT